MFEHQAVIRLGHTDAAGLIYYARLFNLAHEAYEAFLDEIGDRSYQLTYRFVKADGTLAAEARTAHVAVHQQSGQAVELPAPLAEKLEPHLGSTTT